MGGILLILGFRYANKTSGEMDIFVEELKEDKGWHEPPTTQRRRTEKVTEEHQISLITNPVTWYKLHLKRFVNGNVIFASRLFLTYDAGFHQSGVLEYHAGDNLEIFYKLEKQGDSTKENPDSDLLKTYPFTQNWEFQGFGRAYDLAGMIEIINLKSCIWDLEIVIFV